MDGYYLFRDGTFVERTSIDIDGASYMFTQGMPGDILVVVKNGRQVFYKRTTGIDVWAAIDLFDANITCYKTMMLLLS